MVIYAYENYVQYLSDRIESSPQKRGELKDLAKAAHIHPSHISQVMSGKRHLTPDQALSVARYLGLDSTGRDYFLNLVGLARAETEELKELIRARLRELRSSDGSPVVGTELKPEARLEMYISNWYYCAIHILTSVKGLQTIDQVSHHLKLPREIVSEALRTLVDLGFCQRDGDRYINTPTWINLGKQPHLLLRHRINWRIKAFEKLARPLTTSERFVSSVMAVSAETEARLAQMIEDVIQASGAHVEAGGEPTTVRCLNIDWYKV
jgi:uncharacterized protein (TIGR02147 family)